MARPWVGQSCTREVNSCVSMRSDLDPDLFANLATPSVPLTRYQPGSRCTENWLSTTRTASSGRLDNPTKVVLLVPFCSAGHTRTWPSNPPPSGSGESSVKVPPDSYSIRLRRGDSGPHLRFGLERV